MKRIEIKPFKDDKYRIMLLTGFFSVAVLAVNLALVFKLRSSGVASIYEGLGAFPALLYLTIALGRGVLGVLCLKEGRALSVVHLAYAALALAGAVVLLIMGNTPASFTTAGILYLIAVMFSRGMAFAKKPGKMTFAVLLIPLALLYLTEWNPFGASLIMMDVGAIAYVIPFALYRIRLDILYRIIKKTYAAEILTGVLLLIIAFSLVIPIFEPGIATFRDALWYCFAIVSTIGFGDMYATSTVGRMLSVIVGVYGILVVSLITSVIVNFYGEMRRLDKSGKDAEEE